VAAKPNATAPRKRQTRARISRSRRRLRLLSLLALVGVAVYLYYTPLASYFETRNDVAARRAEVEALRIAKTELELRLANSTSLEATRRESRRAGYVLPGEQLFVVKGIPEWRQARQSRSRSLKGNG
jgi:cell division protein FtsB